MIPKCEDAATITNKLLIEIPKRWPGSRCLRRNVGAGVGMSVVQQAVGAIRRGELKTAIQLLTTRVTHWGVVGEADVEGFIPMQFGDVRVAVLMAAEVKAGRDVLSDEQIAFGKTVMNGGGIYTVARNSDDALADIARQVKEKQL